MAIRSRSSLRFAVRRDEHGAGHHDDDRDDFDDALLSSPPVKRPRLQQPQHQRQQSSSRHRKSSPDLLDTTIENPSHSSSKTPQFVRHATHSPLPPPRSSTRRALPLSAVSDRASSSSSAASVSSASSSSSARLSRVGTPCTTAQVNDRHHSPFSASAALYMRGGGGRESPDPLDTISPARTIKTLPPRKAPTASIPTSTTRSTRHSTRLQPHVPSDPNSENPPAHPRSRSSRKSTSVNHAIGSQPLPEVQSESQSQFQSQSQSQSQSQPNGDHSNASPAAPEQRRSLRSKDTGLRARSELAPYFWNYEQILSLEPPKTTELLSENTAIKLIDDLTEPLATFIPPLETQSPFGNPLLELHECERITLPKPDPGSEPNAVAGDDLASADPLNEQHYFRAHRRMERQEKQLRNIERERAQHEKLQLERLLDELKCHDWPRVMGLTGIADPEKKLYEPKRDYFIKEISSLIKKFQIWKEEEKRRKLEKEKSSAHIETSPLPPAGPSSSQSQRRKRLSEALDESTVNGTSHGTPGSDEPDPSDVDAWAAHQLQQEARSATGAKRPKSSTDGPRRKSSGNKAAASTSTSTSTSTSAPAPAHPPTPSSAPAPLPTPPPPDQPFTSFFANPHLREAALGPPRKDSIRMAFGHPLPDLKEREFQPPADILTPEAIDACRRKRRRMRRESRG